MGTRRRPPMGQDYWQKHVRAWRASGLSKLDYCDQNDLPSKSFYHWEVRLRKNHKAKSAPVTTSQVSLIPLDVVDDAELVRGPAAPAGASAGIRIYVRDKFVVELAVGFDAASLERLWKTWG